MMSAPLSDEAQSRLERFKQFTVAHPVLTRLDETLTHYIREPGNLAYILVYGPTGVGKTTLLQRIEQRWNPGPPAGTKPSQPVVLVPTPFPFSIAEWYATVLIALDEPIIEERLYHDVQLSRTSRGRGTKGHDEEGALRRAVEAALKTRGVRAILFDEAQHFMGNETTVEIKQKWDWLKSLSNSTHVLHVLAGPYTLLKLQEANEQAIRRGVDLHFPRYHQDDPQGQKDFLNATHTLLTHGWGTVSGSPPTKDHLRPLLEAWQFFYERSLGMIGILKEWLIQTLSQTLYAGETELTLAQLRRYAPSANKSRGILVKVIAGEQQVVLENAPQAQQQLRAMLGFTEEELPPETPPPPSPKQRKQKPGRRNPTRDPIGDKADPSHQDHI